MDEWGLKIQPQRPRPPARSNCRAAAFCSCVSAWADQLGNICAPHVASQVPKHQIDSQWHGGNIEKEYRSKHHCRNRTGDKTNGRPQPMAAAALDPADCHHAKRYPCEEWRDRQYTACTTADYTCTCKHERRQDSDSSENPRSHCYRKTISRGAPRFWLLNRIHDRCSKCASWPRGLT